MLRRYADILRHQARPGRFLVSRALLYSGLSTRFVIPKRGFRLRFYPTNGSAQQWVDPYHEHDSDHGRREETFFRGYLRPDDVVVDVGASIGLTALTAFSVVGRGGRVLAFEPHPRIFGFLVGNIALNGAEAVITPRNVALGESSGTVFITDARADDANSVSSEATGVSVPISTLDEVAAQLPRIALLKIDVEGYELFVLRGAVDTLKRIDCIYFESYDPNFARHGYGLSELVELMAANGFEVRRFDGAGTTTAVIAAEGSSDLEDLVAVRNLDHLHRRLAEAGVS